MKSPLMKPASVFLFNAACTPDGTGTGATFRLEMIVLLTDEETLAGANPFMVLLDGNPSGMIPNELPGSPVVLPDGMKVHHFEISGAVDCGVDHAVKVIASIEPTGNVPSNTVMKPCPCE